MSRRKRKTAVKYHFVEGHMEPPAEVGGEPVWKPPYWIGVVPGTHAVVEGPSKKAVKPEVLRMHSWITYVRRNGLVRPLRRNA